MSPVVCKETGQQDGERAAECSGAACHGMQQLAALLVGAWSQCHARGSAALAATCRGGTSNGSP